MKNNAVRHDKLDRFRFISLWMAIAGGVCSLILTIKAGHNNKSIILPILFVAWVLSPFIALIVANISYLRWTVFARKLLYSLMLFITIGSLLGYTRLICPVESKPAAVFLIVPLLSWLLISVAYFVVSFKKAK